MATQNSEEHYGTYPLPESQMDRFLLRIRIDYPSPEDERRILLESPGRPEDELARLEAVLSRGRGARAAGRRRAGPPVGRAGRLHRGGGARDAALAAPRRSASRRAAQLAWRNAARAAALAEGRDYVLPDDLKSLAGPVLAHRVIPASPVEALARSRQDVERVLADIIDRLPAPG